MTSTTATAGLFAEMVGPRHWSIKRESDGAPVLGFARTKKAAEYCIRRMAELDVDWADDVQARFDADREFRSVVFELKRIAISGDVPKR